MTLQSVGDTLISPVFSLWNFLSPPFQAKTKVYESVARVHQQTSQLAQLHPRGDWLYPEVPQLEAISADKNFRPKQETEVVDALTLCLHGVGIFDQKREYDVALSFDTSGSPNSLLIPRTFFDYEEQEMDPQNIMRVIKLANKAFDILLPEPSIIPEPEPA